MKKLIILLLFTLPLFANAQQSQWHKDCPDCSYGLYECWQAFYCRATDSVQLSSYGQTVDTMYMNGSNDSLVYFIGTYRYAVKLPSGGGGSSCGSAGDVQYSDGAGGFECSPNYFYDTVNSKYYISLYSNTWVGQMPFFYFSDPLSADTSTSMWGDIGNIAGTHQYIKQDFLNSIDYINAANVHFDGNVFIGNNLTVTGLAGSGNNICGLDNTGVQTNIIIGSGLTLTGTMSPFTLSATPTTDSAHIAGTGISISRGTNSVTITNTAPDQTVSISSGTGISATGTYPNFTVANTADPYVTTGTLANGNSATTQTAGDNSGKIATTAYADAIPYGKRITFTPEYYSTITQGTWGLAFNGSQPYAALYSNNSASALNDQINYTFAANAGTDTLGITLFGSTNTGNITFYLDGVSIGTVDSYRSGGATYGIVGRINGFTMPRGNHTLSLKVGKNSSSIGYNVYITHFEIW